MKTSKILILSLLAGSALAFTACSDDEPNKSISVITPGNTEENDFDRWLLANFNIPYNIDFKYRYEDIQGDFDYYLVPAEYESAIKMAHMVKHLCVETYNEVAGKDFTCQYFPKMFFLTGEWEYKNNGSFILGTAEGGRKIFLAGINYLPRYIGSAEDLNHYYFKTIHHEFTHILNQTKTIPSDFQLITADGYVSDKCFDEPYRSTYLQRGYISDYSQTSYQEDFAEMLSIYVTNDEKSWNDLVNRAPSEPRAKIQQKLENVRNYMMDSFGIDIDDLRRVIQRRQEEVVSGKVDLTDLTIE
ncbi:putative zinc-binding metallopeptidase [Muribaculum sp.]|jgi:substrate import-associated zinc metallohydrolase lipoprotein|uniref:zinc-binding metallopeptidase n=3 Tax=Muribaculum TaxID=1918540 RepID=UPI00257DEFB2|nr:putative zinc-binding metallopeptidase [Muribaculum sp.]